jgi:hypothetical protein
VDLISFTNSAAKSDVDQNLTQEELEHIYALGKKLSQVTSYLSFSNLL